MPFGRPSLKAISMWKGRIDHYQADSINGHLVLTERGGEVSDVDKVKELKRAGATG